MKPTHQATRRAVSLLTALAAACLARATEFGVMWNWPRNTAHPLGLTTLLQTNGIEWVRVGAGAEARAFRAGVFWWPGASPRGATPSGPEMRLADDLWEVYWQGRTNAPAPSPDATAFEIGNEPDLYFTRDLPDRMAATLKAAWWGLKHDHPDRTVLMPSLATAPGPYAELLLANGLGSFTYGWNLHFYGWAQDFAGVIAAHRRELTRLGRPNLSLWVTESGFADFPAGDPTNEILLARQRTYFERLACESAALGVARLWAFMLTPLTEAGLDFGLLGSDLSPRPALSGLLATTRWLQHAEPRYRLVTRTEGTTVGYVFRVAARSGESSRYVTLLFSPSRRADFSLPTRPGDSPATEPSAAPATSLFPLQVRFPAGLKPVQVGLGGAPREWSDPELTFTASAATNLFLVTPERRFTVTGCDWVPLRGVRDFARLSFHPVVERRAPPPVAPPPSPVVVTVRPLGSDVTGDKGAIAYRYPTDVPLRFELRWHNFSEQTRSGSWKLLLPDGWQLRLQSVAEGKFSISPLTDSALVVVLQPPAQVSAARRDRISLEWHGAHGEMDRAVIQMAAASAASGLTESFTPDWQSLNLATMQWTVSQDRATTRLSLTHLMPGVSPGLILPLPGLKRLEPDDVFRLQLRQEGSSRSASLRCEFITPQREVFRHGEDQPLSPEWQTFEWRVGDLTPAFWSHVGPGDPEAARYLRLSLFGLSQGGSLEVKPLELVRMPASARPSRAPRK